MRIEKISGDKIKVTVSAADLVSLDIDINDLSPDSDALHSFLFHIMETIRVETGFNPYNGQVVVEATPMREGISIVVSKVKTAPKHIAREDFKQGISIKARSKRQKKAAIYYFADFDDMCLALCHLEEKELLSGAVYRLSNTYCFIQKKPENLGRGAAVLMEFSSRTSKYPLQFTYIKEHGTLVAEGEKLSIMAREIKSLT